MRNVDIYESKRHRDKKIVKIQLKRLAMRCYTMSESHQSIDTSRATNIKKMQMSICLLHDDFETMRELLDNGADPNENCDFSPYYKRTQRNSGGLYRLVHGAFNEYHMGKTLMHVAAGLCNLTALKMLVRYGGDYHRLTKEGYNILEFVVANTRAENMGKKKIDIIKYYLELEKGADEFRRLESIYQWLNKDTVGNIIEYLPENKKLTHRRLAGEAINKGFGGSLVHLAAWVGDVDVMKFLYKHPPGIHTKTCDNDGFTPLHVACMRPRSTFILDDFKLEKTLIDVGIDINTPSKSRTNLFIQESDMYHPLDMLLHHCDDCLNSDPLYCPSIKWMVENGATICDRAKMDAYMPMNNWTMDPIYSTLKLSQCSDVNKRIYIMHRKKESAAGNVPFSEDEELEMLLKSPLDTDWSIGKDGICMKEISGDSSRPHPEYDRRVPQKYQHFCSSYDRYNLQHLDLSKTWRIEL